MEAIAFPAKSGIIEGGLCKSTIHSYTCNKSVTLICSQAYITSENKVLILDDLLANGQAIRGLIDIVNQAGAALTGVGIAVEKGFQYSGDALRQEGYPIESPAIIDRADENGFVFR